MVTIDRRLQPQPRIMRSARLLTLTIAMLAITGTILSLAAAGPGALDVDVRATLLLQSHVPDHLSVLFEIVNWLGITAVAGGVTVLIGGTLLALRQPVAAVMVLLTFPLRLLNAALKLLIESPRPSEALVAISENANGYGFPSGHTSGATLLFGVIFLVAPCLTARRSLQIGIRTAAVVMIALAGISRIYVGAHWPSDVAGGYLWGSILLLTMMLVVRTRSTWSTW